MKKAWVVSVNMGYGHERAAYPLKDIAYNRIVSANTDEMISNKEKKVWDGLRSFYESVSRAGFIFPLFDRIQQISPFFPFGDESKPTFVVNYLKRIIKKKRLCQSIINEVAKTDLPVVATHLIPALAMDYAGVKNDIYCVVTDSDISRAWVSADPKNSKIVFLTPSKHTSVRLRHYGVPDDKIILTGFPLPKENIGTAKAEIVKADMIERLPNLDPEKNYCSKHNDHIVLGLGQKCYINKSKHPLTITYAVGGAGAQREKAVLIAKYLKDKIKNKKVSLNLVAGTRQKVFEYFNFHLKKLGLDKFLGSNLKVVFSEKLDDYFKKFNKVLRTTDILWTKPSELSFYTGLGIPIITTNPIGSHECYNRQWLEHLGSGFMEHNIKYINDWLFYLLKSGRFAEGCMEGFIEAPTFGTYVIEDIVLKGKIRKSLQDMDFFS